MLSHKSQVTSHKLNFTTKFFLVLCFVVLTTYPLSLTTACAKSRIISAEKLFLEGDYEAAAKEAQRLIDRRSRERDELYYIKALSELKLNKFDDARRTFETLLKKYPRSNRAFDAKIGMGDAYFLQKRYAEAVRCYEEAKASSSGTVDLYTVNLKLAEARKGTGSPEKEGLYRNKPEETDECKYSPFMSIQVGSFKNKSNAYGLARKLEKEGYDSFVAESYDSGSRMYRVRVGRFDLRANAERTALRLRQGGYNTTICER